MSLQQNIKSLEATARESRERLPETPQGAERPHSLFEVGEVTANDAAGNHTVVLVAPDGNSTAKTFELVRCEPTESNYSVGDNVVLWFKDGNKHPVILNAGSGGGGGTTAYIVSGLEFTI
jgi:hypothetical protein